MLSPGSKGWINKYFDIVERGQIVLELNARHGLSRDQFIHLQLANTGITFGYPHELLFSEAISRKEWTIQERLKLLLFESHLFVYLQFHENEPFSKDKFLQTLYTFYGQHSASSITRIFNIFKRENREANLENILSERVNIRIKLFDNKWWVNALSNVFSYLDVLLFNDFIQSQRKDSIESYSTFAKNVLTAIILAAYSDGKVEEKERSIFDVFLASANLDERTRDKVKKLFHDGASPEDFSYFVEHHWLLKRFILDIAILTTLANEELSDVEWTFLKLLSVHLDIPEEELEENLGIIENFLLKTQGDVEFMKNSPSYEKVYSSLSKRWAKIILRNKDKLTQELKESKELLALIGKSTTQSLTKEEKELVKLHFKDIARSIPTLTIFMLPGGTILLPIILKLIPDLIPTAFRENEIDPDDDRK